jgi:hypothetical protein
MEAVYTSATHDVVVLQLAATYLISPSYPLQDYIRFFKLANFSPSLDMYNHTAAVRKQLLCCDFLLQILAHPQSRRAKRTIHPDNV